VLGEGSLRTPRAAAIAGILFSVLLMISFFILRLSVPLDPKDTGEWLNASAGRVAFALNLIPVAGISFLWFIGVLRDRLGAQEDRFFATVFLGSGFLFLASLFVTAALAGAILLTFKAKPEATDASEAFHLVRAVTFGLMNVYVVKLASVFLISASTLIIYTHIVPRWMAIVGYALALLLFFGSYFVGWLFLVLPSWVLMVSIFVLFDNFKHVVVKEN
jgi:hypothetical protein